MNPHVQKKMRKERNIINELDFQAKKLSWVRLGKTGKALPPREAFQIKSIAAEIVKKDPHALPFLIGGAARMYKGQQDKFRDIDIAVVTHKGAAYNYFASKEFKNQMERLVGREVDIFAFKRQHFKPKNMLREMALEQKQELHPMHTLVEGIPLYNIERARNFQKKMEPYVNMALNAQERKEIIEKEVKRSLWRRLMGK